MQPPANYRYSKNHHAKRISLVPKGPKLLDVKRRLEASACRRHLRRLYDQLIDIPKVAALESPEWLTPTFLSELMRLEPQRFSDLGEGASSFFDISALEDAAFRFQHAEEILELPAITIDRCMKRAQAFSTQRDKAGRSSREARQFKELYELLDEPLPMAGPRTSHEVDELADYLCRAMPWFDPVTEWVWSTLHARISEGRPTTPLPPLLLHGPPGTGKTTYAGLLAEALKAPSQQIDATQGGAGFRITGLERGFSSAEPGLPLQAIQDSRCASPVMIVDEVDKIGLDLSSNHVSLTDALLSLLEPRSASNWSCPVLRIPLDLSSITWIMTANDSNKIRQPLRNRCRSFEIPHLSPRALRGAVFERIIEFLPAEVSEDVMEFLKRKSFGSRGESLRDAHRLAESLRPKSRALVH